ncbi:hypothetical protein NW754_000399 [Fusarium falciforme]|nr:hypothetical protein NW754_000399 [Fusarium falciforme]
MPTDDIFQVAAVFLSGEGEAQYGSATVMLYYLLHGGEIPMHKVTHNGSKSCSNAFAI